MFTTIEGVHKNLYETSVPYSNYNRFLLHEDTKYYLALEGIPQYNVAEGQLEVEFYYKAAETSIDSLEQIDPLDYVDRYNPYKYGIIFKERLFVNDETLSTFFLRIANVQGAPPPAVAADPKA
jgi:hypothetical protein